MGKNRGNDKKPVDMTIYPDNFFSKKVYSIPDDVTTESDIFDIGNGLTIRSERYYKPSSRIVWFVLLLFHNSDNETLEISRIDCCHNMIHQHLFNKNGNEISNIPIYKIEPNDSPEATVNEAYWNCYDRFLDEAEKNYESWQK